MAIQSHTYGTTTHQDLSMEGGYGFINVCGFVPQQHQILPNMMTMQSAQQLHNDLPHYRSQNLLFGHTHNNVIFMESYDHHQQCSMAIHHSVSAQIDKHRIELERLISLQNERLRQALQGQRRQHLTLLLKAYEAKARLLIQQKEEEISKEAKRTMELEQFLERMEMENQRWQRLAKEKESMVQSLKNAIERAKEDAFLSGNVIDDAGSCCIVEDEDCGGLGKSAVDRDETRMNNRKMLCRCCTDKSSCVIMLPCRHLCSCRGCEALLDSCPVCNVVKKATIEVLFECEKN